MNIDVTTEARVEAVCMHVGVGKQQAELALVWKFELGAQPRRERLRSPVRVNLHITNTGQSLLRCDIMKFGRQVAKFQWNLLCLP
jgi:hypothetical protein